MAEWQLEGWMGFSRGGKGYPFCAGRLPAWMVGCPSGRGSDGQCLKWH